MLYHFVFSDIRAQYIAARKRLSGVQSRSEKIISRALVSMLLYCQLVLYCRQRLIYLV